MANRKFYSSRQLFNAIEERKNTLDTINLYVGGKDFEIGVRHNLSLTEAVHFVQDVLYNVFLTEMDAESGAKETVYTPVYRDLAMGRAMLVYFTNLRVNSDADTLHFLLQNTDVLDQIKAVVNPTQLAWLEQSVAESIAYKIEALAKKPQNNGLMDILASLADVVQAKAKEPGFLNDILAQQLGIQTDLPVSEEPASETELPGVPWAVLESGTEREDSDQ